MKVWIKGVFVFFLSAVSVFGISCPEIDILTFPADNPWHWDVSKVAVHPNSAGLVKSIGSSKPIHPDFGTGINGIPYILAGGSGFTLNKPESDTGPYYIPSDAPVEGGPSASQGDRHVIAVDPKGMKLYELYQGVPSWSAAGGAIFDLKSNGLRKDGWTSADGAGLPIYPGLVKYWEVAKNKIDHPFRFTVVNSFGGYVYPATHRCSRKTDTNMPKMGQRARLKKDFDTAKLGTQAKVIAEAMKKYGIICADNGGDWFISGSPDDRWNDSDVNTLKIIHGSDMEFVAEVRSAPSAARKDYKGAAAAAGMDPLEKLTPYGGPYISGKSKVKFRGAPNGTLTFEVYRSEKKSEDEEGGKPSEKPLRKIVISSGDVEWDLKKDSVPSGKYDVYVSDKKKNQKVINITVE